MLNKELKFDRYENSFLWLKEAGVVIPVYNAEMPAVPLLASFENAVAQQLLANGFEPYFCKKIIYLPIYMSYLLREPRIEQLIVDLDMAGL